MVDQQAARGERVHHRLCDAGFLEQSRELYYEACSAGDCVAFVCMQLVECNPNPQCDPVPLPSSRIKTIASAMDTVIGPDGHLASEGGTALLMCFRQSDEREMLQMVVRLHCVVTGMSWEEAGTPELHVHTGVSTYPADGLSPDALLSRACAASDVA